MKKMCRYNKTMRTFLVKQEHVEKEDFGVPVNERGTFGLVAAAVALGSGSDLDLLQRADNLLQAVGARFGRRRRRRRRRGRRGRGDVRLGRLGHR